MYENPFITLTIIGGYYKFNQQYTLIHAQNTAPIHTETRYNCYSARLKYGHLIEQTFHPRHFPQKDF